LIISLDILWSGQNLIGQSMIFSRIVIFGARIRIPLLIGVLLTITSPVQAQEFSVRGVIGSGACRTAGSDLSLRSTIGQAQIGSMAGGDNLLEIGFWYLPAAAPVGIDDQVALPASYELEQNYPNPFNPVTTIRFAVPHRAQVRLRLYDIRGRLLRSLLDDELSPGYHEFTLRADDLASGVYFCRLEGQGFSATRQLVLLK
jgi:hypothetical protein